MPWHVTRGGGCPGERPFAVIKDADGSTEGCHPTRAAAERQVRALYASDAASLDEIGQLNAAIFATTEKLFEMHEDAFTEVYAAAMTAAAHGAIARFSREAKVTAMNEPHIPADYKPITSAAAKRIRDLQHSLALDFYEQVSAKAGAPFPDAQFLDELANRALVDLDKRVTDDLREIVSEAVANDASVTATAAQMRAHFDEITEPVARMVAQTQITTLSNKMGLDAAHEVQKRRRKQMYKTWTTQGDAKVRIAHAQTNGQTVPLTQPFSVGGYEMMFPGDPGAPLKMTANCRCFLQYTEALIASALVELAEHSLSEEEIREGARSVLRLASAKPGILDRTEGAAVSETQSSEGITFEFTVPKFGNNVIVPTVYPANPQIGTGVYPYETFTTNETNGTGETATVITVDTESEAPGEDAPLTQWQGIITMEGMSTGDGRYFAQDAWSWRELPLSLYAQLAIAEGHDGGQIAGRIDRIWKVPAAEVGVSDAPEGAMAVMGEGVFDTGEFGQEVARMVKEQTLRGISVDFGVSEAGLWDTQELQLVEDPSTLDPAEVLFGQRYERAAIKAEVGAATLVGHPAFADATISLVASGLLLTQVWIKEPGLTASGAGMAPVKPPRGWFDDPQLEFPTPLTITDEGQVFGHIALWGTCHTGLPGCEQPPHSSTNYQWFHLGACPVDEGGLIPCGKLTFDTGHAPIHLGYQKAVAHYDDTGTVAAHIRAGEDIHGIWIAGALNPDVDANSVRLIMGSTPSGDWRPVNGYPRELMAVLCANMPGFPVPRTEARVVMTAFGEPEVVALVAAGIPEFVQVHPRTREEQRLIRALTEEFTRPTWDWEPEGLRAFSAEERRKMAENGEAMPDGSFPIANCSDAKNARQAIGRAPAGKRPAVEAHIRKRERALGCNA